LVFVLVGTGLVGRFAWLLPLFGILLVYTAFKLTRHSGDEVQPDKSLVLRIARRLLPVTRGGHDQYGKAFWVRENGRLCITPLFLVLLVIESTDVVFAVDSVPAIFGITLDPFIVFTSNIFAILGLRALYFLLAGILGHFRYLHYGLAGVLAFVGLGMIGDYWLASPGEPLVPTWTKLLVISGMIGTAMMVSVIAQRREQKRER
jgi:tellurite resistance protein TerC